MLGLISGGVYFLCGLNFVLFDYCVVGLLWGCIFVGLIFVGFSHGGVCIVCGFCLWCCVVGWVCVVVGLNSGGI